MRAADALMEALKAEGVEVVFGLPGGANLPTYDAFVDDMKQALATDGPVVVDVRVTREENTYPMIAPGAPARDMVG